MTVHHIVAESRHFEYVVYVRNGVIGWKARIGNDWYGATEPLNVEPTPANLEWRRGEMQARGAREIAEIARKLQQ